MVAGLHSSLYIQFSTHCAGVSLQEMQTDQTQGMDGYGQNKLNIPVPYSLPSAP
jgi:hypothetical protein